MVGRLHRRPARRGRLGIPGSGPVLFASIAFDPVAGTSVFVVPELTVGRRDGVGWITTVGDADPRAVAPGHPGTTARPCGCATPTAPSIRPAGAPPSPPPCGGSGPANSPRWCWPATCWSPPTHRSTRAGCCGDWPTASPTAGPSPSTGCSVPLPSCCCGAPAARCRRGCWPARRRAAPGPRTSGSPTALIARRRTAPSTRSPSTPSSRHWSRYCTTLDAPAEPELLTLANVRHLATDVSGTQRSRGARGAAGLLELIGAVHPTAAVCGTPTRTPPRSSPSSKASTAGATPGRSAGWTPTGTASSDWPCAARNSSATTAPGSSPAAASSPAPTRPPSWRRPSRSSRPSRRPSRVCNDDGGAPEDPGRRRRGARWCVGQKRPSATGPRRSR